MELYKGVLINRPIRPMDELDVWFLLSLGEVNWRIAVEWFWADIVWNLQRR